MKFLKAWFKKQPSPNSANGFAFPEQNEDGYFIDDYLGQAANAGSKARDAIETGDFDAAWGQYQEMSRLYLKHAQREGFTAKQTLALVGSVHRAMARLLRQENKHHEALVHILFCTACSDKPLDKELKHYRPFVNRCKFRSVDLAEVTERISEWRTVPDFRAIQEKVAEWKSREDH